MFLSEEVYDINNTKGLPIGTNTSTRSNMEKYFQLERKANGQAMRTLFSNKHDGF